MSNKNLLNESQVRQFMKLANLQPLTPGFIHGLTEKAAFKKGQETEVGGKADESPTKGQEKKGGGKAYEELEELRTGRTGALGPKGGTHNPGHGRGQGEAADGSLFEQPVPPEEEVVGAGEELAGEEEVDLGGEEELAGEEEVDLGAEEGDGGRMVPVDDFLAALESALETAMGEEVEVDTSEVEDEVGDEEAVDDFAPEGDEVVADMEAEEPELQEGWEHPKSATGSANTHKGSKQHPDHRRKKVSAGGLASQGPGLVKEDDKDDDDLEEGVFGGGDKYEKMALGKKGSYAPDPEAGEKSSAPTPEEIAAARKEPRSRRPRRSAGDIAGGLGGSWKGVTEEGNTNEMVEQITKRVAARILKSALAKK